MLVEALDFIIRPGNKKAGIKDRKTNSVQVQPELDRGKNGRRFPRIRFFWFKHINGKTRLLKKQL